MPEFHDGGGPSGPWNEARKSKAPPIGLSEELRREIDRAGRDILDVTEKLDDLKLAPGDKDSLILLGTFEYAVGAARNSFIKRFFSKKARSVDPANVLDGYLAIRFYAIQNGERDLPSDYKSQLEKIAKEVTNSVSDFRAALNNIPKEQIQGVVESGNTSVVLYLKKGYIDLLRPPVQKIPLASSNIRQILLNRVASEEATQRYIL